jgi:hypothetical protein
MESLQTFLIQQLINEKNSRFKFLTLNKADYILLVLDPK